MNQLVLKTLLAQIGVEAAIVGDGLEATEAWEQGAFDLILMDVQMPRRDGLEATRVIRKRLRCRRPAVARVPIVALTADVMSHQVEGYGAAGMDAFVAKPIAITELFAAIAECVGGHEADAPESRIA